MPNPPFDILFFVFLSGTFFLITLQKNARFLVSLIFSLYTTIFLALTLEDKIISLIGDNKIIYGLGILFVLFLFTFLFSGLKIFKTFRNDWWSILSLSILSAGLSITGMIFLIQIPVIESSPIFKILFLQDQSLFYWIIVSLTGIFGISYLK